MAGNEYVFDGDVQRIRTAELIRILPSHGGDFRLMFRIQFKDGRTLTVGMLASFEDWSMCRDQIKSDPDTPPGSGLQAEKKRKADKMATTKGATLQRDKRIKIEDDDWSLPPKSAFLTAPSSGKMKAVEVVELSSDDEIITID